MKKEFFINIIFLVVANLLIKPFYLLWVEVEVNNIVGPAAYGTYAGIFSLCFIFQIIADPGLLNFNTTQISSDRNLVYTRLPEILGLKIVLAFLYAGIVFFIGYISGYGPMQWYLLPWILGNVTLISINLFLRSNISGIGKYRWDSFFSVIDKTLMIAILLYMINIGIGKASFKILDFIQGQLVAYGITTVILLVFLFFNKVSIKPVFKFNRFNNIIRKSLPFAWLLFLMTIYTRIDSFMLERLIKDFGYQAGVYTSAFRIFDAGNSFAYLFAVLLLPILSNMLSEKQNVIPLISESSKVLFTGITIICISFAFQAKYIMSFFYPEDYTGDYKIVFILLMIALIPMALAYITGSFLTAKEKLKELNQIAIAGVCLNIILNFILILKYQAKGAALATAITQGIMTLIQWFVLLRVLKIRLTPKGTGRYILLFISVILICFIINQYFEASAIIKLTLEIIISFIIALILRMVKINFLLTLYKNRKLQNENR